MSRINTNVTALISTRILNDNNNQLNKSLERLSTGVRINRGADDPAGLIASENLRKQIKGTETAISNAERAINIVGTAEGALSEVSDMLVELQGLLLQTANEGGLSDEEIEANQLQADSILNTIDRIANSTEFEGMKLLNGNYDYTLSTSGGNFNTNVSEARINTAKLIDGATMQVDVNVTTSANTGFVRLSGMVSSKTGAATVKIGSARGSTELTFAVGTSAAGMATSINEVKEVVGVSASTSSDGQLLLRSVDFGSDAYVSVEFLSGNDGTNFVYDTDTIDPEAAISSEIKSYGADAEATINGSQAIADGKILTVRTAMLDAEIDLSIAGANDTTNAITFGVTSGGADFMIGSTVDAIGLESIGIMSVTTSSLGNATDGRLSTLKSGGTNSLQSDNLYTAQRILNTAIDDVSGLRGRLGSFQSNTLDKTINSLTVTKENLSAAESAIRDTDFATETSALTRSQILVQSATNVLSQANTAPQNVLQLLS